MPNVSLLEVMNSSNPNIAGIVQIITNNSVFMKRLRFIQKDGFSHIYGEQKTTGGIAFRGINQSYTSDTGVVNPKTEILKIFGGSIRTDRQLARGPKGNAVRAGNIANKVKRASLTFDYKVIKGDSQQNPYEFDGLNKRLLNGQLINAGGPLTLPALDLAIDQTVGTDDQKIIVCNKATRRQINKLIIDAAGGAAVADVKTGVTNYKGAAIDVVDEDGDDNPILTFNESAAGAAPVNTYDVSGSLTVLGNSLGTCTSLYVYNPSGDGDEENMRGLVREVEGVMIEQIQYGERSGFFEDLIEAVMGLAIHHPRAATRLYGITSEDITQETAAAA